MQAVAIEDIYQEILDEKRSRFSANATVSIVGLIHCSFFIFFRQKTPSSKM